MNTKPKPLPDVERINIEIDWDNLYILRDHIRTLIATIPRDKSSSAYALWLMAQGYKIRMSGWTNPDPDLLYIYLDQGCIVWSGGNLYKYGLEIGSSARIGWHWTIYEEPPAVDDDELRRKCVEYSRHMLTIPPVSECPRFTPAELARLKELQ